MKKNKVLWENPNRAWMKDKNGDVWMIQRTPYKEIPVVIFKPPKLFNTLTIKEDLV